MEVLLLVETSFDVWIWWKINRVSEALRKELVVWPGYLVLQTTMRLFFFYKPLNKTTKLVSSSTIRHPCQLVQSLLGWLMCLWMGMEILGLPVLWQDHFQWRGEHHPDVGTIPAASKDVGCDLPPALHKGPIKALFLWGVVFTKARALALQDLWSYFIVSCVLWMLWKPKNVLKLVEMGFVMCERWQSDPH